MSTQISQITPIIPSLASVTRRLSPLAEPLLRAAAGLFLVPHGAQKLFGWFGGYGLEATSNFFAAKLGLPPALALIAGLIELVGGLMLAFGFLTRAAAALATGLMLVATLQVHLHNGFFWTDGGFEYPLMWAITTFYFVLNGGGRLSIDGLIGREI